MDEQRIWAPWRIGYVSGKDATKSPPVEPEAWNPGADESCFLCRAAANFADPIVAHRQLLIVSRGNHIVTVLNRYPYANGHLLVAPLRHVCGLHELTADEHLEAMQALGEFTQLLQQTLRAEGFNVGLNLGRVAGAGVPGHLHWHLVPRWSGDTNFMPALAGIRMIPQSLEAVWEALAAGAPSGETHAK